MLFFFCDGLTRQTQTISIVISDYLFENVCLDQTDKITCTLCICVFTSFSSCCRQTAAGGSSIVLCTVSRQDCTKVYTWAGRDKRDFYLLVWPERFFPPEGSVVDNLVKPLCPLSVFFPFSHRPLMCCWLWPGYLCLSTSPQGLVCTHTHTQSALLVKVGSADISVPRDMRRLENSPTGCYTTPHTCTQLPFNNRNINYLLVPNYIYISMNTSYIL